MSRRFVRGATPTSNTGNNKWVASSSSSSLSRDDLRGRGRGGWGRGLSGGRIFSNHSAVRNEAPTSKKWIRAAAAAAQQEVEISDKNNNMNPLLAKSSTENIILSAECKEEELITSDVNKSEPLLERRGRHKLVMKTDESAAVKLSNQKKSTTKDRSNNFSWKRKSTEIPVQSNDEGGTYSTKPAAVQNNSQSAIMSRTSPHVGKRKHPDTFQGPRRICLSSAATDQGNDADRTEEQRPKTLTDFQYKDTSARGRGRGRGKAMGLVRVIPKHPSEMPICPTFCRGLPCNDTKCTLRHDVSTDASRPMCVFFQRNGMCSKGSECPFKHVKISWDAEICPTFDKLGYCEDESCVLRHVASKRSKTNAPDKR